MGFCTIHVDSRPNDRKRKISREALTIHFDTRVKDTRDNAGDKLFNAVKHCQHEDQDAFNNCLPVNCETYYNGNRPYINKITKRCTRAPACLPDSRNDIYDPVKNLCVDIIPIADHDIEFIKSLARNNRLEKDIIIEGSRNQHAGRLVDSDLSEAAVIVTPQYKNETQATNMPVSMCYVAAQYISKNKYTIVLLCFIVVIQCFMIIGLLYCMTNCSSCTSKKKVFCKFFNDKQDASVTTPLIGASNDFTETTEFDFVSESSNIYKKIKCYKACQKENNAKASMSDDILSKCLNRRDWRPMSVPQNIETDVKEFKVETEPGIYQEKKTSYKPESEHNLHLNNLEAIHKSKTKSSSASDRDVEGYGNQKMKVYHSDSAVSETEIRCFNYNFQHSSEFNTEYPPRKKSTSSVSTEKGAQASFSNDSIDDLLSERGMVFLGKNASKFSFTPSTSPGKSSMSNLTSKTSKNNIVKRILSYLSKSKHGTSSDPGDRKSSKEKNLELIHITKMTTFSSSGELDRNNKIVKESRSSF